MPSVVAEKEVAAEHTGGARSLPRRRWQRAARALYRASEGALAMPAYRCFGIRLATVVEDLSPEGARQISSL